MMKVVTSTPTPTIETESPPYPRKYAGSASRTAPIAASIDGTKTPVQITTANHAKAPTAAQSMNSGRSMSAAGSQEGRVSETSKAEISATWSSSPDVSSK